LTVLLLLYLLAFFVLPSGTLMRFETRRDRAEPGLGPNALDLSPKALAELIAPLSAADDALARLDERLRKSPVREGFIARTDFAEACASLWAEGELVHLEDLVLRDARMDIRTPSHELVRAEDYLRLRRKAAAGDPKILLTLEGICGLLGRSCRHGADGFDGAGGVDGADWDPDPGKEPDSAAAGAALTILRRHGPTGDPAAAPKDAYDETWDEAEELAEWRQQVAGLERSPPLLGALLLAHAWQAAEPIQRQARLAPILAGLYLRQSGRTKAHFLSFNLGLRSLRPKPRPRSKVEHIKQGLANVEAGAREGLAQHDRLMLAREVLARKCEGRRANSHLKHLAELLLAAPLVSVPMIAKELKISLQAAQILVGDLGSSLREITGRKRYRAWTVG
jgi:Protein of unknown function (DUF1612)/HTH DNA binding domain